MSRTLYLTDEEHGELLFALGWLEQSHPKVIELTALVQRASRNDVLGQLVMAVEAGKMLDHSVTQPDGTRVWLIDELAREIVERT